MISPTSHYRSITINSDRERTSENDSTVINKSTAKPLIKLKPKSDGSNNYDSKTKVSSNRNIIVLSERDVNRDTTSQATEENANFFNLTPDDNMNLTHSENPNILKMNESMSSNLPPKSYSKLKIISVFHSTIN